MPHGFPAGHPGGMPQTALPAVPEVPCSHFPHENAVRSLSEMQTKVSPAPESDSAAAAGGTSLAVPGTVPGAWQCSA